MNGKEPAFPFQQKTVWSDKKWSDGSYLESMAVQQGLSKRELFAAMAMQGMCIKYEKLPQYWNDEQRQQWAKAACSIADALIAELSKDPDGKGRE